MSQQPEQKPLGTPISSLGKFAFIDKLTEGFTISQASTVTGPGDDAAVIDSGDGKGYILISTDMLMEGVNFDLTYFPLKHLGYKAVVVGISDIVAMNGTPRQITVSLALSARFTAEDAYALYDGVRAACEKYNIDLIGGDTTASLTGMAISVTSVGYVEKESVAYRSGAKPNDLICVTGDLGAAYMGLQLLEREKRVFKGNENPQPKFEGYEYLLRRQLQPDARVDIIEKLRDNGITPTSMIDISAGLSSELLHLCKRSSAGARIYLERIPISREASKLAEEMNIDPVVAALNGGDDYELLFTAPIECNEKLFAMGVDVIGHVAEQEAGVALVTPDGQAIPLRAQGWTAEK